ncbi:hypothetical protein AB0395_20925 [Streptosporangium sp. NPDC051023]|uniref:hypothetical protein n=1 Tax=Streptosporangium sp. NPDC051023 TaxID=3155410 RepID=UPI00344BD23F
MKKIRALMIGAAVAAAVLTAAPAGAAVPSPQPSSSASPAPGVNGAPQRPAPPNKTGYASAQAVDGYLYVWKDAMWDYDEQWCRWSGSHAYWTYAWSGQYGTSAGECSENDNFDNVATSMWNNGYPGSHDDVRFYKDSGYEGTSMCLGNGDYWGNLALGWERFDDQTQANDEISSHTWVRNC